MSNISPINVRIASKTRHLETTGDSSYYYSGQLITNMALLKALKKLGQQLSWPSKGVDAAPAIKHGSSFIAKANQSANNPRIEPLINLKATPGREWIYANLKLIEKLLTNHQFFNSKTIGLLAKGLGRSGRFNSAYILEEKNLLDNKASTWFTSFDSLAKLAKYCCYKYYKQPRNAVAAGKVTGPLLPAAQNLTWPVRLRQGVAQKQGKQVRLPAREGFPFLSEKPMAKIVNKKQKPRNSYRKSLKTRASLPFYLTALGLIGHNQVLRNSLVITPIISGSLQSNLLLADHTKTIKTTSSSGLGLVSASPNCYIARSPKNTVLNFFFRIPAKLNEKNLKSRPLYNQVYIIAALQGLRKSQKGLKQTYASVRWL